MAEGGACLLQVRLHPGAQCPQALVLILSLTQASWFCITLHAGLSSCPPAGEGGCQQPLAYNHRALNL